MIEAFILGLIGGAVPGPILTGTFAEILRTNFIKGLRIIFLALIAETIGALLTIYIFYEFGLSNNIINIISICGACVLFWLASKVWNIDKIKSENNNVLTFSEIIILTALNSGYWIFWITVGIPKALMLDNEILGGKFLFLIIFEIAWLTATVLLAYIFFKSRSILEKKNLIGTTFKILAVVLIILGVKTLLSLF